MYLHEHKNWTDFRWDNDQIAIALDQVSREQGRLFGRLSTLGFDGKLKAMAENLTRDVVYSSEIEGIRLNVDEVRSSIARRLGIENIKQTPSSHYVDGVVEVMLDAMEHYDMVLTKEKLCAWQAAFFPLGTSNGYQIEVGQYRTHEEHIVSGYLGRERIHYVAPSPDRVEAEMAAFIDWFNAKKNISPIICSAIAHFWFVSIHPFEDGNGRLSRIIGDMILARGDKNRFRFYNISSQINQDKNHYYSVLEQTQHGDGDITQWLAWYLKTLLLAITDANATVSGVFCKNCFWMRVAGIGLSDRQSKTLNMFLDGYEAKITSKMWAQLNKCSKDTAIRDIQDLVDKGILAEDIPGARRPSYSIVYSDATDQELAAFADVAIKSAHNEYYLTATLRGDCEVREKISALDAQRYASGDLPLHYLLDKYCSYLLF